MACAEINITFNILCRSWWETVEFKIITVDFDEIWFKCSKDSRMNRVCMFDAVSSKRTNFDEVQFFKTYT